MINFAGTDLAFKQRVSKEFWQPQCKKISNEYKAALADPNKLAVHLTEKLTIPSCEGIQIMAPHEQKFKDYSERNEKSSLNNNNSNKNKNVVVKAIRLGSASNSQNSSSGSRFFTGRRTPTDPKTTYDQIVSNRLWSNHAQFRNSKNQREENQLYGSLAGTWRGFNRGLAEELEQRVQRKTAFEKHQTRLQNLGVQLQTFTKEDEDGKSKRPFIKKTNSDNSLLQITKAQVLSSKQQSNVGPTSTAAESSLGNYGYQARNKNSLQQHNNNEQVQIQQDSYKNNQNVDFLYKNNKNADLPQSPVNRLTAQRASVFTQKCKETRPLHQLFSPNQSVDVHSPSNASSRNKVESVRSQSFFDKFQKMQNAKHSVEVNNIYEKANSTQRLSACNASSSHVSQVSANRDGGMIPNKLALDSKLSQRQRLLQIRGAKKLPSPKERMNEDHDQVVSQIRASVSTQRRKKRLNMQNKQMMDQDNASSAVCSSQFMSQRVSYQSRSITNPSTRLCHTSYAKARSIYKMNESVRTQSSKPKSIVINGLQDQQCELNKDSKEEQPNLFYPENEEGTEQNTLTAANLAVIDQSEVNEKNEIVLQESDDEVNSECADEVAQLEVKDPSHKQSHNKKESARDKQSVAETKSHFTYISQDKTSVAESKSHFGNYISQDIKPSEADSKSHVTYISQDTVVDQYASISNCIRSEKQNSDMTSVAFSRVPLSFDAYSETESELKRQVNFVSNEIQLQRQMRQKMLDKAALDSLPDATPKSGQNAQIEIS